MLFFSSYPIQIIQLFFQVTEFIVVMNNKCEQCIAKNFTHKFLQDGNKHSKL